jgi:hypothetical protein
MSWDLRDPVLHVGESILDLSQDVDFQSGGRTRTPTDIADDSEVRALLATARAEVAAMVSAY